jgi:single-strand DNA-binding protein
MLIGNVGKDPEIKDLDGGKKVVKFSMAMSDSWKDKSGEKQESTEWVNVVAWDKLAEIIGEYVKKGKKIYIEGKMKTRKYDKDGVTHYATEVVADKMIMLDSAGSKAVTTEAPVADAPVDDGSTLPF